MRIEDAPPAGWYPDPEGGSRLRWWQGTDWADRWRAPPTPGVVEIRDEAWGRHSEAPPTAAQTLDSYRAQAGIRRPDADAIVDQVRLAARQEAERAAQMFGAQARSATQNLQPLITEYTSKITRWIRILSTLAILLLILWVVWQVFVQVSLFEWIGDRIDNLTEDGAPVAGFIPI